MTPEQAEQLRQIPKSPVFINADDWDTSKPRTLLYGYTCERETFHVYVDENAVHAIVYQGYPLKLISHNSTDGEGGLPASMCVPNKRVYSQASDFEFCRQLLQAGLEFSFTSGGFRPVGNGTTFVGETLEQITASIAAEEKRIKENQCKVGEVTEQ